jgi:hypothetical protein
MGYETHAILDGKVHVYRRENSRFWQCSTYMNGRNHRQSTKEEILADAKLFAHEWYLEKYVDERRRRRGELAPEPRLARRYEEPVERPAYLPVGTDTPSIARRPRTRPTSKPGMPTFRDATKEFVHEYEIITQGERNAKYVKSKSDAIRVHLLPFFGDRPLFEITSGLVQEYRVHRATSRKDPKTGEPLRPARSTLHSEIVTLRQVLKTANRKGWIAAVPDMSAAYKSSGKVSHRA